MWIEGTMCIKWSNKMRPFVKLLSTRYYLIQVRLLADCAFVSPNLASLNVHTH